MEEWFFSGYCRHIDDRRMVALELEDGVFTADCSFGSCPYEDGCPIAQSIREKAGTYSQAISVQ